MATSAANISKINRMCPVARDVALGSIVQTLETYDAAITTDETIAEYTATAPAAIPDTVRKIELNHETVVIAKTIASLVPYAGKVITVKDTSTGGTAAHTVTVTTGTWNGTNKVITLNAPNEFIAVYVDSAGNGTILENVGAVGLSG